MMKKDLVIGCVTGYDFNMIRPWVNSLDRSGYTGEKAMVCYNVSQDTVKELTDRGYQIFAFNRNEKTGDFEYRNQFSIVVERFLHLWFFLKERKGQYRYIVTTDVKDVIFQSDPMKWLEENIGDKKINLGSESITYENEEWGANNLFQAFGHMMYDTMKNKTIVNAGTVSGEFDTMLDLFLNIYLLCNGLNPYVPGGGGPDQAALNILANLAPYSEIANVANSEDGWAAQLGTTGPQMKSRYNDKLIEKTPIMVDGVVCTSTGKPFALVHQYDRIPEWKNIILEKYK
jgi:hypothetical protein